ncbi:helix-turn-helix domain-containing protein [Streptomyces sp. NPDC006971]|uniref:helix-turn-helix domain-containing protein n=1 Tax=Streptomyces sp. NPDC006971 TaxID=3154784 RepID=UPI00341098CA
MTDQLGTLLRRLRTRSGLTQEQLGERSGVSVSTIRRLETGRSRDHRLGTLNLLADALEVGPDDRRQIAALLAKLQAVAAGPGPAAPGPASAEPASPALESAAGATEPASGAPGSTLRIPEQAATSRESTTAASSGSATGARLSGSGTADSPGTPPVPHSVPAARTMSPVDVRGALADAAAELAREIGRRWRREEEQRRVHDPFPLPVRWREAPEFLTDYPENIQRLPSGATPHRIDLEGDVRSVAEVYRRIRSGRLVILGRAGSGKSILTIRFVLDYLEDTDHADKVPVIFSLGSWDPTTIALRDWLVDRLVRDHPHLARRAPDGGPLAAALVDAGLVLPVLDGFDEVAEGLRQASLEALNAVSLPLVLTSRRAEFAEAVHAAGTPLVWAAGIELTDLALDDLVAYLPRTARPIVRGKGVRGEGADGAGVRGAGADGGGSTRDGAVWGPVLDGLRDREGRAADVPLARVLNTPLMIVLARTMYSEAPDRNPVELLDTERFPDEKSLEEHLLAGFVPTVYRGHAAELTAADHRRGERNRVRARPRTGDGNRDPEGTERWLGYLAHHLARLDRDQQDLAWWRISGSVRLSTRVAAVALASALSVAVSEWLVALFFIPMAFRDSLLLGSLMGTCAGLSFACVYGIMAAVGAGAFEPSYVRLRLHRRGEGIGRRPVRVFTTRFGAVLLGGFVMGVGCASSLALQRRLSYGIPITNERVIEGTLINMLAFGLIFGAGAGLVFGLLAVLEAPLDVASAATPAGLLAWNRTTVGRQVLVLIPALTLAIALDGYLFTDLLQEFLGPMNWELEDGLVIGAVGGLGGALSYAFSFTAWGQWVILARVWLPLTGKLPWDTVAFLDDAYRRGVLRQTGAVYQFRHIRLQHHLGRSYREQQARYAPAGFPGRK